MRRFRRFLAAPIHIFGILLIAVVLASSWLAAKIEGKGNEEEFNI